jgi:hypothetical protein
MSVLLVPLAVFLINETTKDIFVLPSDAVSAVEGAKPCAPIKTNIVANTFTSATLDQMCTSLTQTLLPKIGSVVKTGFSSEHAQKIGGMIRSLQTAPAIRANAPLWPPEIPFSLSGLTSPEGMTLVFGVKIAGNQAVVLDRIDVWSNINGNFTRTYWSRSLNDPTYSSTMGRITARVGSQIQRVWKGAKVTRQPEENLKIIVDKKISERELAVIENVLKTQLKVAPELLMLPVDVNKDGIVYATAVGKARRSDVAGRLSKELPVFQTSTLSEGPADIKVMLGAPQ